MKLVSHKPKNRWHSPTFTLRHIKRETLSLILNFAEEGIEKHPGNKAVYESLLEQIRKMDTFIHGDEFIRYKALELD